MFFIHKWEKSLESDIDCTEASVQPYIALFYAFRKIRHDFANYVQTLQLFAETENYDEKKKMKQAILGQIKLFYEDIPQDTLQVPALPVITTIRGMQEPLQKLEDQLERSLDPDESETEALLSGLDQFRSLPTEETSALSVLMDLCMQEAEQNSCLLRYKICQPTWFQMAYPDMLLLYRQLFLLALSGAGQSGGKTDMSSAVIRLRSAEKFNMWHLHLEFPCTPDGQDSLLQMQKTQMYRCIRKLSKTYKLQLKFARISDGISLDLVK